MHLIGELRRIDALRVETEVESGAWSSSRQRSRPLPWPHPRGPASTPRPIPALGKASFVVYFLHESSGDRFGTGGSVRRVRGVQVSLGWRHCSIPIGTTGTTTTMAIEAADCRTEVPAAANIENCATSSLVSSLRNTPGPSRPRI
ncbi:hypothetical protein ACHAWF_003014 [Thalassiosira exigua]